MKVKVEKAGPCRKLLSVELPADAVAKEYDQVITAWAGAVRIPGFRKGKAPRSLVETHFAKEIEEEVKERLIAGSYSEALKQEKIDPVAILNLESHLAKGQALTYKVTLDVPPEFKLPKYKGLALKSEPMAVSDERVQQALDEMLDQFSKYELVEGQPVQKSDLAQIDYEGACEGQPEGGLEKLAAGLGQGKDFWVMADENAFLPGFDTGLLGMAAGEQREVAVAFPAEFKVKAVAGRSARYRVTLKAIRRKKRPTLDAALLKELQAESEDALRGKLRAALEEETQRRERERLKNEICRQLLARADLDLPATVVEEESRRLFASTVRENLVRGVPRERVEQEREKILAAAQKSAGEKVKLDYILHRIAEEEGVAVDETEVASVLQRIAARSRVTVEEARKALEEKEELESLRHEVRMNKTLDLILTNARVGEEEGFFKRLMGK